MTIKGKTRTRNARVDVLKFNARARLRARAKAAKAKSTTRGYNRQAYDGCGHGQEQGGPAGGQDQFQ